MKKLFFVMILAALLILSGCNTKKDPYQFPNSLENVVSIELLHNRNENGVGTDWDAPPSWGYGDYIAKVSYFQWGC